MSHENDKAIELVVRLISLTNSKRIKWKRDRPPSERISSDRRYRNFMYVSEVGNDIFRILEYEYMSFYDDERYWVSNIELEIIDIEGQTVWICPPNPALHDLFQIVVEATADIDGVMARLDSFAKAS